MKTIGLLILFFVTFPLQAQIVNIPDANFKNALVNTNCVDSDNDGILDSDVDINDDGEIQVSEALVVLHLDVGGNKISSLDGIGAFVNLETLDVWHNSLYELDLSNNEKLIRLIFPSNDISFIDTTHHQDLETLDCSSNNLTTLDLSENSKIRNVFCSNNDLEFLNISENSLLRNLHCDMNNLISLDVSNNLELKMLDCNFNKILNLDVSNNTLIENLYCRFNPIADLNLSNNIELNQLMCDYTILTSLDVSQNPNLGYLRCSNTKISHLDLSNNILGYLNCSNSNLSTLNIRNGYNFVINYFDATNNLNLYCIEVDDEIYSNNQPNWNKDPWAFYSENCKLGISDVELNNEVLIYPIPVTETLYIESNSIIQSIIVFDILGKNLFNKKGDIKNIDFTFFPKGVYFLEITKENEKVLKRVIKH